MQCLVTEHHITSNGREHYGQSATTSDWNRHHVVQHSWLHCYRYADPAQSLANRHSLSHNCWNCWIHCWRHDPPADHFCSHLRLYVTGTISRSDGSYFRQWFLHSGRSCYCYYKSRSEYLLCKRSQKAQRTEVGSLNLFALWTQPWSNSGKLGRWHKKVKVILYLSIQRINWL